MAVNTATQPVMGSYCNVYYGCFDNYRGVGNFRGFGNYSYLGNNSYLGNYRGFGVL